MILTAMLKLTAEDVAGEVPNGYKREKFQEAVEEVVSRALEPLLREHGFTLKKARVYAEKFHPQFDQDVKPPAKTHWRPHDQPNAEAIVCGTGTKVSMRRVHRYLKHTSNREEVTCRLCLRYLHQERRSSGG